jgi:hypothetical protein
MAVLNTGIPMAMAMTRPILRTHMAGVLARQTLLPRTSLACSSQPPAAAPGQ